VVLPRLNGHLRVSVAMQISLMLLNFQVFFLSVTQFPFGSVSLPFWSGNSPVVA
jgi:hypothetical protein